MGMMRVMIMTMIMMMMMINNVMIFYQLLVRLPGSAPHPIEVVVPWTGSKALDDNDNDNDNDNEN